MEDFDKNVVLSQRTRGKAVTQEEGKKLFDSIHARFKKNIVRTLIRSQKATYILDEKIGSGSFGDVFKAYADEDYDNPVAIKRFMTKDMKYRKKKTIESEIAALLLVRHRNSNKCHPALVCMIDLVYTENYISIVMEYVPGKQIASLPVDLSIRIIRRLTEGIKSLHDIDLIHRDIKPANIMITPDNQVKIVDLGLACLTAEIPETKLIQKCISTAGSYLFMDPMIFTTPSNLTKKSDIYSLGATLACLILGINTYPKYATMKREAYMEAYESLKTRLALEGLSKGYHEDLITLISDMCHPINIAVRPDANEILEKLNRIEE